jgi:signal transduction histidine kinase
VKNECVRKLIPVQPNTGSIKELLYRVKQAWHDAECPRSQYFDEMKLTQQAILTLALPLAFELVLFVTLIGLVAGLQADVKRGTTARVMMTTADALLSRMYSQSAAVFLMEVTSADFTYERFRRNRQEATECLKTLHDVCGNDPGSMKDYNEVKEAVDRTQGELDAAQHDLMLGAPFYRDYRSRVTALKSSYSDLASRLDRVAQPYRSYDREFLNSYDRRVRLIMLTLVGGAIASILLAGSLGLMFYRSMKRQLNSVLENIYNYGLDFNTPEKTLAKDEIASIDTVFLSMARAIVDKNEQLKSAEARVRAAMEGLSLGVLVLECNWNIKYSNATTTRLLRAGEHLTHLSLTDVICNLQGERLQTDTLESAVGKPVEVAVKTLEGLIPLEMIINDFVDPDGPCYIVSLQDISERHEVEALRRKFVAMVSHEIRTPLTAIRLMLDLVFSGVYGKLDESGQAQVSNGRQNCQRLIALVNDLIDAEKIRRGNSLDILPEPCVVKGIIAESIGAVSPLAHNRQITLLSDAGADVQLVVDRGRLIQALINFLSNAIKFSPIGGVVSIATTCNEQWCEISVTDQGRGVPSEKHDQIFDSFVQVLPAADAQNERGAGIGLAICKSVARAHNGDIGVRSNPGQGSTFWIRIPLPQSIDPEEDTAMVSAQN